MGDQDREPDSKWMTFVELADARCCQLDGDGSNMSVMATAKAADSRNRMMGRFYL
jgi:hypothetical protein